MTNMPFANFTRCHHRPYLADKTLIKQASGPAVTCGRADADLFRQRGIRQPPVILQQSQHLKVGAV
jgi:hypothetical protein